VNWLFIHQNFPAQYVHLAAHLARSGQNVVAITQRSDALLENVRIINYEPGPRTTQPHDYLREFDASVTNGIAVAEACKSLHREGFMPDMVIGHNGWGELLYVKDVWPRQPLLAYFEFFYRASGSDADFDPETPIEADLAMRLRTRNGINLLGLEAADWGQTPTRWQQSQYPEKHHKCISVIHDGIDTELIHPEPNARLWLEGGASLGRDDEVVTYSARNLEPYRGFHVFMRSLPKVLRSRPNAHALIVGGDGVSYGRWPSRASSWRQQLLGELAGEIDLQRVHFVGRLPFRQYLAVLQLSSVHVYLTYPFVLSWSLLEAMSAGCHIVASRTAPVEEVISDGKNGWLVDFFDTDSLADRIIAALRSRRPDRRLRAAARDTVIKQYDLRTVCLPAQLALLEKLIGKAPKWGKRPRDGFSIFRTQQQENAMTSDYLLPSVDF
jgi:glycosyltransferase involved in cell wall biosynthesis